MDPYLVSADADLSPLRHQETSLFGSHFLFVGAPF